VYTEELKQCLVIELVDVTFGRGRLKLLGNE